MNITNDCTVIVNIFMGILMMIILRKWISEYNKGRFVGIVTCMICAKRINEEKKT